MSEPIGVYLHIPFCSARCGYCDFVTFTGQEGRIDAYVEALRSELHRYGATDLRSRAVSTVFFGGGTPSLLEALQINRILEALREAFHIVPGAEVTLEANPESVTPEKAAGWRKAGINRISLGLQTLDDGLLKAIGRLHDTAKFISAYEILRQAGFSNINVDLIYGLPGQSLDSWKETLTGVTALSPEHVSAYALQVEDHTPFAAQNVRIEDDVQAEMYDVARRHLASAGLEQYEISNFARPGLECRHNLIYWRQGDYLGCGVGAVGTVGTLRWTNSKDLQAYHRLLQEGQLPRAMEERLSAEDREFERMMLGLRLREGTLLDNEELQEKRNTLQQAGQLERSPMGHWRVSDPYVPLTNQILLSLLA
jgi:oxygen-independent coproporphyrinogen III oxidase